jgi:hypothetical protein
VGLLAFHTLRQAKKEFAWHTGILAIATMSINPLGAAKIIGQYRITWLEARIGRLDHHSYEFEAGHQG